MGYCILVIDKVKTAGALAAKYRHNFRIEEVPNADSAKRGRNKELVVMSESDYVTAVNKRIASSPKYVNHKPRRDAVIALEVMLTYSSSVKEGSIDHEAWERKNVEWLNKEFGRDNVISVMAHYDEHTPHIHAIVVPMIGDRLCAKEVLGGKAQLASMQSRYARAMKEFGLERGLEQTRAKHEDVQKFYAALNKTLEEHLPTPYLNELATDYKERAERHFSQLLMQQMDALYKEKRKTLKAEHEIRKLRESNKELEGEKLKLGQELDAATRNLAIAQKKADRMDEILDGLKHGALPEEETENFMNIMKYISAVEREYRARSADEERGPSDDNNR